MSSYQRLSESNDAPAPTPTSSSWLATRLSGSPAVGGGVGSHAAGGGDQFADAIPSSSAASSSTQKQGDSGFVRDSEDDQVLAVGGLYNPGYAMSYPSLEPFPLPPQSSQQPPEPPEEATPPSQLPIISGNGNTVIPTNTITRVPVLVSDDILTGSLTEAGRMSPVRRFFCLLVTFDVLFTGLLWTITVIVTGRDLAIAMRQQVLEYRITSSMFDCVMCASLRFAVCIVCYAAFHLRHWWPISLTTAGTSAFLIAKVFKYQWSSAANLTFDVTLVLLSFILAWGELWFLDFRVLPLESKAKEVWLTSSRALNGGRGPRSERDPLLTSGSQRRFDRGMMERYMESAETASNSNFYSIAPHSEDEDELEHSEIQECYDPNKPLSQKVMKSQYKPLSKEVLDKAWTTMTKSSDWKFHSESKTTGDKIETKVLNGRKIFKLTTTLEIPARILLEELFYKAEGSPDWNDLVTEIKIIQSLDSNTDALYQVCANGLGGGVVSTRDFVYLRHWQLIDGVYVMSMASINHSSIPHKQNRVRCEAGPCCFALKQSPSTPNKCTFQWLFNNDLKLSLPRFVIDKAVISSQTDFMNNLRRRIEVLKVELNI